MEENLRVSALKIYALNFSSKSLWISALYNASLSIAICRAERYKIAIISEIENNYNFVALSRNNCNFSNTLWCVRYPTKLQLSPHITSQIAIIPENVNNCNFSAIMR